METDRRVEMRNAWGSCNNRPVLKRIREKSIEEKSKKCHVLIATKDARHTQCMCIVPLLRYTV